jgi:hypothetical protein
MRKRIGGGDGSAAHGAALGRRALLKSGAAIGAVGMLATTAGCATTGSPTGFSPTAHDPRTLADSLDPDSVDALLASVDRRLAWMDQQHDLPTHIVPLPPAPRGEAYERQAVHTKRVVTRSLRSLYLTGCFIDLPDEIKTHPDVLSRFASLRTDMDDAVLDMTAVLKKMTPADHRATQAYLRKNPDFGEHVAKYLEQTASEDRLPFKRRFGVRASVLDLSSRMRAQSPALVVDPIVSKVERLHARPRTDAEQIRLLSAKMGEEVFWAHQEKLAALHDAWTIRLSNDPRRPQIAGGWATGAPPAPGATAAPVATGGYATGYPIPLEPGPVRPAPGASTVAAGRNILGASALSLVLGLAFWQAAEVTAADAFLFPAVVLGITVGPILLVVGLLVLLVGAAMQASG